MQPTKTPNWPHLLLISAILFGGVVRLFPGFVTRFPVNDGGMFLEMTRDLQTNHYLLPATTSYNGLALPFAYPPLGFYLVSLLADLGRIPLLELFLWVPPLLATLAIFAFYLFARALLADDLRAALAAVFFALTPGGYDWQVMGGGVTRSLGLIFLLLGARQAYLLFQERSGQRFSEVGLAILFCSLAVLSHPEIAVHAVGLCALLWLFFGRTRRGVIHAAMVAGGVFLLTAPWWAAVIFQNGSAPFMSAGQTGLHGSTPWWVFFTDNFTLTGFLPFVLVLRAMGIIHALIKRQWFFLSLLVVPYLADPRSAPAIVYFGLCILSALALFDAVPALIGKLWKMSAPPDLLEMRWGSPLILALVVLQFLDCGFYDYRLINTTLTPADRQAMTWVREDVPAGKNFFLLTGRKYSMTDPVQEWFPALSGEHSQTTLQGLEWTLGKGFVTRLEDLAALQSCANINCVESWSQRTDLKFDFLWVSLEPDSTSASLATSLRSAPKYRPVYESDSVVIFAVEK